MRLLPFDPRPGRVVRRLQFAADGRFLAGVAGRPDDLRRAAVVFDLAAGLALRPVRHAGRLVGDPVFGPDPRVSAWLSRRSPLPTLILTDGRGQPADERGLPPDPHARFTAVGFSPDGGTLYLGSELPGSDMTADTPTLRVSRLDVGYWLDRHDPDRIDEEPTVADWTRPTCFADSGAGLLAVGTAAGTALLLDLIGGGDPLTVEHEPGADDPAAVEGVLLSPDGRHLVTRAGGTLAVWDTLTGRELARPGDRVSDAAFAPEGWLVAVGLDGRASRFSPPRYGSGERLDLGHGPLYGVAVAPDGLTAAAGTGAGTVVLWDV